MTNVRNAYGVESVIDQVLQIFAHADLPHQFVFVTVHSRELADVSKYVLQTVGQLESVNVVQPVLDMGIDY